MTVGTPPPTEGSTKLEYDPVTDGWQAIGFEDGKWKALGRAAYNTFQGAKLDLWYRRMAHSFKEKIRGKHRQAAEAARCNTLSQSLPVPGGGTDHFSTTANSIPVYISGSSGLAAATSNSIPIMGTITSALNTVSAPLGITTGVVTGFVTAGHSQYYPQSGLGNYSQAFGGGSGAGGGLNYYQQLQNQQMQQLQLNQMAQLQGVVIAGNIPDAPVEIPKGDTKFGEIVAWRAWRGGPQGLLMSMAMETLWIPGEPMTGDPTTGHSGVYAWKTRDQAITYANPPWRIIGEIYLYGTVDEYEDGYRAEYASIKSLDVIDDLAAVNIAKPDVTKWLTDLRTRYIKPQPKAPE